MSALANIVWSQPSATRENKKVTMQRQFCLALYSCQNIIYGAVSSMTEEKNEVIFDDDKISKSEEFVNPDELYQELIQCVQ